ncbi:MAG: T9SS C-terminal target domain-containing protein [Ignavibacteriales bacterium]|nr:MAG: T9SS C-terminal target domain-containing protein [Ignavibacteriales bacterium]
MRKFLILFLLTSSSLLSQSDFWSHYSLNLPVWQIVKTEDENIYAVTDSNIFKSTDFGLNWVKIFTNIQAFSSSRPFKLVARKISNQTILIVRYWKNTNFITQKSVDGGTTWSQLTKKFRSISINNIGDLFCVGPQVYDSLSHPFIYHSTDFGDSWSTIYVEVPDTLKGDIEIDNNNNIYLTSTMFYPGFPDPIYFYFKHYLSKSGSTTTSWSTIFERTSGFSMGELIMVDSNNLILNIDYEKLFQFYDNTIIQYNAVHPINGGIMSNNRLAFISSESFGISQSTDNGQTWFYENSGLPSNSSFSLVRDDDGYIYTGTNNGIFRSNYPVVNPIAIDETFYFPTSWILSDCYPNPFNPKTTIEYSVPKLSKVRISVFNLLGEEIAVLINEEKTQGNYKVEFNGANLTSGVYFYKMQTEEYTSTKKFILLK